SDGHTPPQAGIRTCFTAGERPASDAAVRIWLARVGAVGVLGKNGVGVDAPSCVLARVKQMSVESREPARGAGSRRGSVTPRRGSPAPAARQARPRAVGDPRTPRR